jgi:phenylacetate-CoA ligase
MTSGGSTGEPGQVIQDYDFSARAGAIQLLFSRLVGRETGECEVYLWGSEREITKGRENWKARFASKLTNSTFINAFRISSQNILEFVEFINQKKPKLIVAYAESIFGVAQFIESQQIYVCPQKAIITSAGTLYPFMREKIERVFQCKVFNRYGSREIGNIACERPGVQGLWVAPWGNYIEILNDQGNRVLDGEDGEIIVTSLINYAMPLLRYKIDDHGSLLPQELKNPKIFGQVFQNVLGRSINIFKTKTGVNISPGYLVSLIFDKEWVKQYQIIQKDYLHILFKIILANQNYQQSELDEIIAKTRQVFGNDCLVEFDFVKDVPATGSGKFLYLINEIKE